MEPFKTHTGIVAALDRADVDTDAVIPIPWMKAIEPDYAKALFANWRWKDGDGVTALPDFVLNRPAYRKAQILVAGDNFGCGSSREHAPWALQEYGFRAIIAPSYGDIFFNNSLKNGLLPIVLDESKVDKLFYDVASFPGFMLEIDLERQTVTRGGGEAWHFDIEPFTKAEIAKWAEVVKRAGIKVE